MCVCCVCILFTVHYFFYLKMSFDDLAKYGGLYGSEGALKSIEVRTYVCTFVRVCICVNVCVCLHIKYMYYIHLFFWMRAIFIHEYLATYRITLVLQKVL